jgi:hypothetical protein
MRPGYLAVLASRTLGLAPVLRPATPSRFEPDGAQAGWEQAQAAVSPARRRPARADTAPGLQVPEADPPLLGFSEPAVASERFGVPPGPETRAAPGVREPGSEPAWPRHPVPPVPARAGLDAPVRPAAPDAASAGREAPGPEPAEAGPPGGSRAAWPGEPAGPPTAPAVATASSSSRTSWHHDAVQSARSRPEAQAAGPAEAPAAEPPIVVRIGRVDVRAAHAPAPPAPARRVRPQAGPSLADYLLAQERRHR